MGNLLAYADHPEQLLRTVPTAPPSGDGPPTQGGPPNGISSSPTWAGSGNRRELQTHSVSGGDAHVQGGSQPAQEPHPARARQPTGAAAIDGSRTGHPHQGKEPDDPEDPPRPGFLPDHCTTSTHQIIPVSRPQALEQLDGPDCARSDASFDSAGSQPTSPETGQPAPSQQHRNQTDGAIPDGPPDVQAELPVHAAPGSTAQPTPGGGTNPAPGEHGHRATTPAFKAYPRPPSGLHGQGGTGDLPGTKADPTTTPHLAGRTPDLTTITQGQDGEDHWDKYSAPDVQSGSLDFQQF